jgi:hypothetical protein
MSTLTTEQPPPTKDAADNAECWPAVVANFAHVVPGDVLKEMMARDQLGRQRYGTPLRVWNGRDALADAYQELLDAVVYLEQCRQRIPESTRAWDPYHERDVLASLRNEAVGMVVQLRKLVGKVPTERP